MKPPLHSPETTALSKYIAQAGYCSRRQATELIKAGKVKINGFIITQPFTPVLPNDLVNAQGHDIKPAAKIYILFNKPKNLVCTLADDKNRKTVSDVFKPYFQERLYPIGRLDRATTGLLIMTNDGQLTQRLSHPKYEVQKVYKITAEKIITKKSLDQMVEGINLEDGFMKVDEAYYPTESKKVACIALHSGKNQVVRRLFKAMDYDDIRLDRIHYAGLSKKDIPVGSWRHLTKQEVAQLYESSNSMDTTIAVAKQETIKKNARAARAKKYYGRL